MVGVVCQEFCSLLGIDLTLVTWAGVRSEANDPTFESNLCGSNSNGCLEALGGDPAGGSEPGQGRREV